MKQFRLVMIAAILGIGFSAFTPDAKQTETVYFRDNGAGDWISQELTPCATGSDPVCEIATIGYGTERIFKSASTLNPFTKP